MKHFLAAAGLFALMTSGVFAQAANQDQDNAAEAPTAEEIDQAVKTINAFAADEAKIKGYCDITKEMGAVPETDEAKMEELGKKMDDYVTKLGEPILEAFAIAEAVDPESEDGKKIDEAFGAIEEKCGE